MTAELHLEVMPAPMQRVFEALATLVITEGFYLAGDTAVAPAPPLDKRRKMVYNSTVILRRATAMMAMRRLPTHTDAATPKPRSSFSGGGISIY
jgi:phosphotransacetylase